MTYGSDYDAERLAALIGALPAAPKAWIEAAQELPTARRGLDDLVARAEADAELRARLLADLEAAVAAEGVPPSALLLAELRERLASD